MASSVNAACLAALDSGIDMKCMFGAATCSLDKEGALSLLSAGPNSDDVDHDKATFTFAFENLEERMVASHTEGTYSPEDFWKALYLCRDQTRRVFQFYKNSLIIK